MRVSARDRTRLAVVVAALVVLGCGGAASSGNAEQVAPVAVTERDNGRTLTVVRGAQLVVTLHSTYWTFGGSSNPAVLQEVGQPVASPGTCPPGVGCGQVTAAFTAVGGGRADVTASRSSCGEALSCTGSSGSFRVSVVVGG